MNHVRSLLALAGATGVALSAGLLGWPPAADADSVGYLVNITVRPGYNFLNADQALAYGYDLCEKIGAGARYPQLVAGIKDDFGTSDEFQASYLIAQATQELCPESIWQLRNSAAHYVPSHG